MNLLETLFFVCLALVGYAYLGYPLCLLILAQGRSRSSKSAGAGLPAVSIVLAAYNESAFIRDKIHNCLSQEYPSELLDLVVVSDGSSDGTVELAESASDRRVTLIALPERGGKANALSAALRSTTAEIVVFTDANVFFTPTAVQTLVRQFDDPSVGCVSGRVELSAQEDGEPLGEGLYMQFERFLYEKESQLGCMAGVDGAMFACRRELIDLPPPNVVLDDFFIAVSVVAKGFDIRYEPQAAGTEMVPASVSQEFRRKVRIAAGAFQILPRMGFLLSSWNRPVVMLTFISHKLLRWFSPVFLLVSLASCIALANRPFYLAVLSAYLGVFGLAAVGALVKRMRSNGLVYVPYYFCAINLAFLLGMLKSITGNQSVMWQRVDR